MGYSTDELMVLKKKAVDVRANILRMLPAGKVGHLGGSSSAADVAAALYFKHMHVYPDPKDPRRDRCIFSKGHSVLTQYACLVELGYFDRSELDKVKTISGILQGHPDNNLTPGIEAATGSLGQGLSISVGMAMGLKLDESSARVYCVIGDGEQDEGQIWEAAMSAAAFKVDNLCAILDYNRVQATDTIDIVFPVNDVHQKWESFGWHVLEADGHDMAQILEALDKAKTIKGKPCMIVAHTIKGKGFAFAENKAQFHNAAMSEEQYKLAQEAVTQMRTEV
jgi:transketolase